MSDPTPEERGLIWVKPKPGMTIRDPITKLIMPPEGRYVHEHDMHYATHVTMGDLEVTEAPKDDAPPADGPAHTAETT